MPIEANPRPASTVVLLRDAAGSAGRPEVFLVRRHQNTAFMGGAHVFPGGRVEEGDRNVAESTWCDGLDAALRQLGAVPPVEAVAFHVAAVRELFEEAGVLLARDRSGFFVSLAKDDERARFKTYSADVHAGSRSLRDVIEREKLRLALDALVPFAHWVTPPIDVRQFDTRFFLARVPPIRRRCTTTAKPPKRLDDVSDGSQPGRARSHRPSAAHVDDTSRARAVRIGGRGDSVGEGPSRHPPPAVSHRARRPAHARDAGRSTASRARGRPGPAGSAVHPGGGPLARAAPGHVESPHEKAARRSRPHDGGVASRCPGAGRPGRDRADQDRRLPAFLSDGHSQLDQRRVRPAAHRLRQSAARRGVDARPAVEWGLEHAALEPYDHKVRGWDCSTFVDRDDRAAVHADHRLPAAWSPATTSPIVGTPMVVEVKTKQDFDKYRGKLRGAIVMNGRPAITPTSDFSPKHRG